MNAWNIWCAAGAQVLVAFADGTLSGCAVSQKSLQSLWNVPLGEFSRWAEAE